MIKNIILLSTGGTIASTKSADNRSKSGELTGNDLISRLSLPSHINVEVESIFQKPSNALTFEDLIFLREKIISISNEHKHAGIVITHGTDTLEDSAFFLQACLPQLSCSLIVTGSQRAPHLEGTDAYTNLMSAIVAASSDKLMNLGVLVVFNESIYSANQIRKVNSFQVNGFDSPGFGHLGYISENKVHLIQRPELRKPIIPVRTLQRVDIITACLAASPAQLSCSAESGAKGIVLEGIGKGHVPPSWIPLVKELIKDGVKVAVVTGSLQGSLEPTYDFRGCLKDLLDLGVIAISDFSARKARILLMLALSSADIEQSFLEM
ncbi:MAG: asparaginase [Candidatus Oceanisphaera merdipullorum]|nr:asparaginase [Candidatus Oceanisphaera merdipullorum]